MTAKKCKYKICKTHLDLVNSMECNKCHNYYCLDHRLYEAHNCHVFMNETKINELDIIKEKMFLQNQIIMSLKKDKLF